MSRVLRNLLTDVEGIFVGHHHVLDDVVTLTTDDSDGTPATDGTGDATGCTVVLLPRGTTASVDVRGGGPGTRETDLLDPSHSVQQIDAVLLTGGSAYGLAAADGVMRWLEDHGRGVRMGRDDRVVPIVPGAVIFDLPVGRWSSRPTAEFGYAAAEAASVDFALGSVGAGTGARAGVLKGGVGSASVLIEDGPGAGITVSALMVCNPVGSVFSPQTGLPWGLNDLTAPNAQELHDALQLGTKDTSLNTTIGVVATDAPLSAAGCRRVAVAGHDGLARAIRPAHSPLDGDTIFAVATGTATPKPWDETPVMMMSDIALLDAVCAAAAPVVERAIVDSVLAATSVAGIPTYRQTFPSAGGRTQR